MVGLLVGGEGFFGIFMPAVVGGLSDQVSRGRCVGGALGPVLAGGAILLMQPVLTETKGYGALWFTCSAALLLSLPFLLALRGDDRL